MSKSRLLWFVVRIFPAILFFSLFLSGREAVGQGHVLDDRMHHLRISGEREWADFPLEADAKGLVLRFDASPNASEQTLRIRQYDVKQTWQILLNDHEIGTLLTDEKDTAIYLRVPPGALHAGENTLRIEQSGTVPDDVRLGEIRLVDRPVDELLSEATVVIEMVDLETGEGIPARLTIVDARGVLQSTSAVSNQTLAVRPGTIYSSNGKASFGIPAGAYTIYAGRGPEYSVDSTSITLERGDQLSTKLTLRREVPTEGWVSSDTHVHTFTHSGHGDATMEERAITIAGEGLELPILTDHNVHVDIGPTAEAMGVRAYYTPIVGNEVTTPVGHFNVFPAGEDVQPHKVESWEAISRNLRGTPGAVILNHARDVHAGFRPFGPARHLASAGMSLDGWTLPANAMEVFNSGSQQTDMMRLFEDWFGMLNRGHLLTPVGSSDSHDVSRFLVGQGRTYIRGRDEDPGDIDVHEVVENFREGKVTVSFGLFAEIVVNDSYGPGDLVPTSDEISVTVRVLGPSWLRAERVMLFANGQMIRDEAVADDGTAGVKWNRTWTLPRPEHDVFLVAMAVGPGLDLPFWSIARPYQPASPVWDPQVVGSTGAVWIDADGDERRTSAFDYAHQLVSVSDGRVQPLIDALAAYDEAVAVQAAALLHEMGVSLTNHEIAEALRTAAPATQRGFEIFVAEWNASASAALPLH